MGGGMRYARSCTNQGGMALCLELQPLIIRLAEIIQADETNCDIRRSSQEAQLMVIKAIKYEAEHPNEADASRPRGRCADS
ncbi:hypothetical protein ANCCAN_08907 [Ancylostoma caninum]|uniref:Uncharacterized protein n=1 Tax=Ancylostoma caninum TaxID=29170 RepID=A0A368GQA2_ANCCA|nr:hypothetical protein ANCCAN_08907 [Ancylostoma caninum]